MNLSFRWLREIAPSIDASPAVVAERLAMLGAPVDDVVSLGGGLADIRVGRVREVREHPNADRLRLCLVEGGAEPVQVVCGAANVKEGAYYPFAPVGSTLPGGMKLKKVKLRGEASEGMLCSARELELGRDHEGIMTLHGEWTPGTPFVKALGLDDTRLVIDVTPNRPDLLSHIGVAAELAPGGRADLSLPPFPGGVGDSETGFAEEAVEGATGGVTVRIEEAELCPRYLGAVVEGVGIAPSPEWLATRIRAVGGRPVNNVVDATNYVLHELGQPLHAFDLDRLEGSTVIVRRARTGESIRTLDGEDRDLESGELVIADAERPIALAGVMGGEDSEVGEGTTRLFLECAIFDPGTVRASARGHNLSSDASYRFERGVDPEGARRALERVISLIRAVAGGTATGPALDLAPRPFERPRITLRPERVGALLGVEVGEGEISSLLEPIGFGIGREGEALEVSVPGIRPDVTREVDLIEEIARRRGYDAFPDEVRPFRPGTGTLRDDAGLRVEDRVRGLFVRLGFLEARTTAFAPAADSRVPLLHPLSAEESHLRATLRDELLRRIEFNMARGNRDVRLFEVGTVFRPSDEARPAEARHVAAVMTGGRAPGHWSGEAEAWDAWDLRGKLEEAGRSLYPAARVEPAGEDVDGLVPARAWRLIGEAGAVHGVAGKVPPGRLGLPEWAGEVWAMEIRLDEASPERDLVYAPIPAYPAVERDVALLAPTEVAADAIRTVIREVSGDTLERVDPFDVYEGEKIPAGHRSIAWTLRFRSPERTLTDREVDTLLEEVLSALADRLNVRLRK